MCGIVGYTGVDHAVTKLFNGLFSLEYRGYDSAGIAFFDKSNKIETIKAEGRVSNLEEIVRRNLPDLALNDDYGCAIAHTRWATHGKPSDVNSHPHSTDNIVMVHNGIIENYLEYKKFLENSGYVFVSETDTEVLLKLIDFYYTDVNSPYYNNPIAAIRAACGMVRGSYAVGLMFKDYPGIIYATRKASPLIIAKEDNGNFIASDIPAVLKYTNQYYHLDENCIAVLSKDNVTIYDGENRTSEPKYEVADLDRGSADRCGYEHFMLKEIHENPKAIKDTVISTKASHIDMPKGRINIVGCGTAMHAGLVGKFLLEKYAGISTDVHIASEFRYTPPHLGQDDLVILISQSGETADTVAALRLAKEKGAKTMAIVNSAGSTIAREADNVIFTKAGIEIAVASTKAYCAQLAALYTIAFRYAAEKNKEDKLCKKLLDMLDTIVPQAVMEALEKADEIASLADHFTQAHSSFFIGRGIDWYLASESSLKLKEISYVHSESYAAGEMKHGTISLIASGSPVVALATSEFLFEKTLSNVKEVKARGAFTLLVCGKRGFSDPDTCDYVLELPETDEIFSPFTAITYMQLLAYYVSVKKGCDVDKPRNLAKSVTVE